MDNESSNDSYVDVSKAVQTLFADDNNASVQTASNVSNLLLFDVHSADDVRTKMRSSLGPVVTTSLKDSSNITKEDFQCLERNAMQNVKSCSNQPHSSNRNSSRQQTSKRRGDPPRYHGPKKKSRRSIINNIYYGKLRNLVRPSNES